MKFKNILKLSQSELKEFLRMELIGRDFSVISRKGFLYATGDIPVMLVAHLDTVHRNSVKTLCYSGDGRTIMSPEGIGGDDRCGVYMIMQIIKEHRCHVLFCEDEETGGIGAKAFADSDIKPNINYIIELDRRGDNDAVFYRCGNDEFTKFICSFGLEEVGGSFSDISTIAPKLGIAAVNISAGFNCEHTLHEYIDMNTVRKNIKIVAQIVGTETDMFKYVETPYVLSNTYKTYGGYSGWESSWDDYYSYRTNNTSLVRIEDTTTVSKKKKVKNWWENSNNYEGYSYKEKLMPLPDGAYIKMPDGNLLDNENRFYIDDINNVYRSSMFGDFVYYVPDFEVLSEHSLPIRYDDNNAVWIEVCSDEYYGDSYES